MTEFRRGLPPLPHRVKKLPLDPRGYPIPWFVETLPDGTRDFRIASAKKRVRAVQDRLCWICGEPLGKYLAFVIGPMCAVNRNTSEPPSHRDCAEFAATACPFLTRPKADYRKANMPSGMHQQPGSIRGNPSACCIWITHNYKPYRFPDSPRDWLIRIGDPIEVLWYCEGKPATRAQIMDSFERRLPELQKVAASESAEAEKMLAAQVAQTMTLLPAA